MSTERQKMQTGEMYDPLDPELVAARDRARDLCRQLNATSESQESERRRILRALFGTGTTRYARSHPSTAITARTSVSVSASSSTSTAPCSTSVRCESATSRCSGFPCRPIQRCIRSTPSGEGARSSESPSRSGQTCGAAAASLFSPAYESDREPLSELAAW
jgi:hypothetical protein